MAGGGAAGGGAAVGRVVGLFADCFSLPRCVSRLRTVSLSVPLPFAFCCTLFRGLIHGWKFDLKKVRVRFDALPQLYAPSQRCAEQPSKNCVIP